MKKVVYLLEDPMGKTIGVYEEESFAEAYSKVVEGSTYRIIPFCQPPNGYENVEIEISESGFYEIKYMYSLSTDPTALHPEMQMYSWFADNDMQINVVRDDLESITFGFSNKSDAMRFKLMWGNGHG